MIETNRIEPEPVSTTGFERMDELEAEYCCHMVEANTIETEPVSGIGFRKDG